MSDEKKELFQDWPMKPMIILPPNAMSAEDIAELRKNHLCVVVAKEPHQVKFVDPIPAMSSRTEIENAAIQLSRKLLAGNEYDLDTTKHFAHLFVKIIAHGTPLDPRPTVAEREKAVFDTAKEDELRRLAREEAKAERAAVKAKVTTKP